MKSEVLYTPLRQAKEELHSRRLDQTLSHRVEDYLSGHIPTSFRHGPKAVSTIQVATPNCWCLKFLSMAREAGLPPFFFEHLNDLFLTMNYDKACMAKMTFCQGRRQAGHLGIVCRRVVKLDGSLEKRPFRELVTLWGESFVAFHHRALKAHGNGGELWDGSQWYAAQGGSPRYYYPKIFALFLCHGILFENYLLNDRENAFTHDIVLPAFWTVTHAFGMRPLIVQVAPKDIAEDKFWWRYPADIERLIPPC